jgi:UDPglucose 6-dehydrogenase
MRLSVFGLGKVGSPLAAVFASKGHHVIGVDVAVECVRILASGKAPVQEPHLQELINTSKGRLSATVCYEHAVLGSDVSFVIVPAPSGENGMFVNRNVIATAEEIGKALRNKTGYHVVTIVTTVMPGSTGGEIREAIEKNSGRRVGDGLGLCYSPEFIALGNVIHDMLNPDFILLGASDSRAGDVVETLYRSACDNNPPIRRMNLINAEIAKLSLNTYLTTKISYANMLADICERLPGADVDVVTSAIGLDARIGSKYLKGAISFGGPCFPRDNVAFAALARTVGARADIAEATTQLNSYHAARLLANVCARATPGSTVGILGLSYKPDTPVIDESPGIALAIRLRDAGYLLKVFDPLALAASGEILGKQVLAESMETCVRQADLVVITTPWPVFSNLNPRSLRRPGKPPVIIDCWRVLRKEQFEGVAEIVYPGCGDGAQPAVR